LPCPEVVLANRTGSGVEIHRRILALPIENAL
jgi:hypothetical protein